MQRFSGQRTLADRWRMHLPAASSGKPAVIWRLTAYFKRLQLSLNGQLIAYFRNESTIANVPGRQNFKFSEFLQWMSAADQHC